MKHTVLIAWMVLFTASACTRTNAAEQENSHTPAPRSTAEPGELHAVLAAPVQGRTGPGGEAFEVALRTAPGQLGHARRFGSRALPIALRTPARELEAAPCTSCHMGRRIVMAPERIADAHQDVQPTHPLETGAKCATCHSPADVEMLALQSGQQASLDHGYLLCAQCHSAQLASWSNGAHGKRLDGWQGRRVVMNCADCHDPHAPGVKPRLPFRPPRLHRTEK